MPSTTTIASSITSPIATASPPSDIRFRLAPNSGSGRKLAPSVSGTASEARSPCAPIAQEQRDHQHAQRTAEQDRVAHRVHGVGHQGRLVVDRGEPHAMRQRARDLRRRQLHRAHHFRRAGAGQARDAEQHRLTARTRHTQQAVLRALAHISDRRQPDRTAGLADRDRRRAQIIQIRGLAGRHDRQQRVRPLEPADRAQHALRAQLFGDLGHVQVQRRAALRIEDDLDLAHVAAQNLDAAHAAHARERGLDHELAQLTQAARVDRAGQIVSQHGKRGGVQALDRDVGRRGQ